MATNISKIMTLSLTLFFFFLGVFTIIHAADTENPSETTSYPDPSDNVFTPGRKHPDTMVITYQVRVGPEGQTTIPYKRLLPCLYPLSYETINKAAVAWYFGKKPLEYISPGEYRYNNRPVIEKIKELAEKTELLPLNILGAFNGVENSLYLNYMQFRFRYDLTFDRYEPLSDLRDMAFFMSKDDLERCLTHYEDAAPKEKALILTAIYLFGKERRAIKPTGHAYSDYTHNWPICNIYLDGQHAVDKSITDDEWDKLYAFIEKAQNDTAVAFPKLDLTPEEELKEIYKRNIASCNEEIEKLELQINVNDRSGMVLNSNGQFELMQEQLWLKCETIREYFYIAITTYLCEHEEYSVDYRRVRYKEPYIYFELPPPAVDPVTVGDVAKGLIKLRKNPSGFEFDKPEKTDAN